MTQPQKTLIDVIPEEAPKKVAKLQWNLVSWFGSSLGATIWMIATPFFLNWPANGVFAGVVGTLTVWSFASVAWALRARISPFRGFIGILFATVLANLSFILFAHANKLPLDTASEAIETNYGLYYSTLLMLFLSLLFFFWFRENKSEE